MNHVAEGARPERITTARLVLRKVVPADADAMIALQRAEMTLQLTVQIRNKLVQAYQDVMRMPV